ncbi:hypothetical protein KJ855_00940 [Patescibacteria group bacterium]|nr:hypothetical protein [Patescibacteria group bacterium]
MIGTVMAYQGPYDYQIVAKSDNAVLSPGESTILWVKLKNTGRTSWFADNYNQTKCQDSKCLGDFEYPIRLGTVRPTDRNSGFFVENNWIATNRTHMADETIVDPGQEVSFGFYVNAPQNMPSGVYREHFAPVIENVTWMADKGLYWDIEVRGNTKRYEALENKSIDYGHKIFNLKAGETYTTTFEVKNTGEATWYKLTNNPVRLAVKYDGQGTMYHSSWISKNRAAELDEYMVKPGEYGYFTVTFQVPADAVKGTKVFDSFWIVAEHAQWFDLGPGSLGNLTLDVNVTDGREEPVTDMIRYYSDSGEWSMEYPSDWYVMEIDDRALFKWSLIKTQTEETGIYVYKENSTTEEKVNLFEMTHEGMVEKSVVIDGREAVRVSGIGTSAYMIGKNEINTYIKLNDSEVLHVGLLEWDYEDTYDKMLGTLELADWQMEYEDMIQDGSGRVKMSDTVCRDMQVMSVWNVDMYEQVDGKGYFDSKISKVGVQLLMAVDANDELCLLTVSEPDQPNDIYFDDESTAITLLYFMAPSSNQDQYKESVKMFKSLDSYDEYVDYLSRNLKEKTLNQMDNDEEYDDLVWDLAGEMMDKYDILMTDKEII